MSDVAPRWTPRAFEWLLVSVAVTGLVPGLDSLASRLEHEYVVKNRRLPGGAPWPVPVTVDLPESVTEAASDAGRLVLTDLEGTPAAEVFVTDVWVGHDGVGHVGGRVRSLPGAAVLPHCAGRAAAVVADRAPQCAWVAAVTAALSEDAQLIVLVPDGSPGPEGLPARVIAAAVRTAFASCLAHVVVVPLDVQLTAGERGALLTHVAAAVGAEELLVSSADLHPDAVLPQRAVLPAPAYLATPERVVGSLDRGLDLPGVHTSEVARLLAAARPPRSRRGLTIFFTGFSGSGKSTVARGVHDHLERCTARTVSLLDGDVFRRTVSAGLGFSRADRESNVRRIGYVATEVTRHGGVAVCAPIAPYDDVRREVRRAVEEVGDFLLVHVATPLEVCEARDRKGLYAAARAGTVVEFTGISDPYEVPEDADLVLDATSDTVEQSVERVLVSLRDRGAIPGRAGLEGATWTSH